MYWMDHHHAVRRDNQITEVFVVGFLLSVQHSSSAPRADEIARLDSQAQQLYQAGRYAEAISLVQRELELSEK
jgi:hypothetical protein